MPELEGSNPHLFEVSDHAIYWTRKTAISFPKSQARDFGNYLAEWLTLPWQSSPQIINDAPSVYRVYGQKKLVLSTVLRSSAMDCLKRDCYVHNFIDAERCDFSGWGFLHIPAKRFNSVSRRRSSERFRSGFQPIPEEFPPD
jgi:hypothetical protein